MLLITRSQRRLAYAGVTESGRYGRNVLMSSMFLAAIKAPFKLVVDKFCLLAFLPGKYGSIFHGNYLYADASHEMSNLFYPKK